MSTTTVSPCLPTASSSPLLSSPALVARPTPSSFVTRNGSQLFLDGQQFKAVGPNIYWLGLDENVVPNPSWPSTSRVLEVMGVANAMGANTIRSTTLGVSVGTPLSIEPSLGQVNEAAFASLDWAVWAAKSYGLRLILPLTDQYDYYHGGIPTFLRWRNLSASSPSDYGPFYDVSSDVFQDFTTYLTTLISHRSNLTGLTLGEEPTVLAFETGNELGGWGASASPPPVEWTTAIAQTLKQLAPNSLVISGSYGVRTTELSIAEVDIYSDHYYPPYASNLKRSSKLAASHNKAFLAGEFDWTDRYYQPLVYLAVLAPVLLAAVPWLMPARWWPWRISLGCCCCRRKSRRQQTTEESQVMMLPPETPWTVVVEDDKASSLHSVVGADPGATSPKLNTNTFPPFPPPRPTTTMSLLDRSLLLRRWHFSILILAFAPIIAGIISVFLPTPLHSFLSALESSDDVSGSFYWSLFGRDDTCCGYVQHDDGYTLHYPSSPAAANGNSARAVMLARHAWRMQQVSPNWLSRGSSLDKLSVAELPGVVCPQQPLTIPVNASWTGGNGTLV